MERRFRMFGKRTGLIEAVLILTVSVLPLFVGSTASADYHHGHFRGRVGVFIGGPVWGPWWDYPYAYPYYYPYYYPYVYPPVVEVPSTPQTYVEESKPESPATQPGMWYYCPESKKYYPYVRECAGGWQKVPSTPEAPEPEVTERSSARSDNWYYCPASKTYYPYVKECPGGWQQVPVQPSSGPGR